MHKFSKGPLRRNALFSIDDHFWRLEFGAHDQDSLSGYTELGTIVFPIASFPFPFFIPSHLLFFSFFFVTLSTRGKKRRWCFHRLSSIESIVVSRPCFQGKTQSRTFAHNHGTDLSSAILGDFHRNAAHELNTFAKRSELSGECSV